MNGRMAIRTVARRIVAPAGAATALLLSVPVGIPAYAASGQSHAAMAISLSAMNHDGAVSLSDVSAGGIFAAAGARASRMARAVYHRSATYVPTQGAEYTIVNVYSGLCLDDYQFSTSNDTDIVQHTCDGYTNQLWRFVVSPTSGYYYIQNVYSGLCVDDYQFSTSDGTPIVQHACDGYTNQRWALLNYQGNPGLSVTNYFSGKVLDDYGFSTTKNIIRQYHYDGYTNQQWYLD